jgi:hypothetical protein
MFSPDNSQPSSPSSASTIAPRLVPSTTVDAIQTVNIHSHVPIILELNNPNYTDWRMFFDSATGKFSLNAFISSPTPVIDHDADWYKVDSCIINWIYTTCRQRCCASSASLRRRLVLSPSGRPSMPSTTTINCSAPSSTKPSFATYTKVISTSPTIAPSSSLSPTTFVTSASPSLN